MVAMSGKHMLQATLSKLSYITYMTQDVCLEQASFYLQKLALGNCAALWQHAETQTAQQSCRSWPVRTQTGS